MKSIEELQADLKQLYAELEERRLMEQESIPQAVNFAELSSKAERVKIEQHPMNGRAEREQQMYVLLLLSVIALDDTAYGTSFSLLYRISHGMGFKGDVQELFLQAQQINFERIDEITRLFLNEDVRLVMLMECMMLAQGFKKEYKKAMEYIAELCILMKLEKEQVILISNIARAVLMQDIKEYKCDIKNTYDVFNCYLLAMEKGKQLEIILIQKDCRQYTTQIETIMEKSNVLRLDFSERKGATYQYCYKEREMRMVGMFRSSNERKTIDLFKIQNGHECVCFKEKITVDNKPFFSLIEVVTYDDEPFSNVLVAVTSNAPNLAYSLAMKRYKEAGGITE